MMDHLTDPFESELASRLLQSRTIILSGEVNEEQAARVTAQLTALAADADAPITFFINAQGGHAAAGDALHDMVRFVKPRVRMIGTGWVAGAAALVYVAVPRAQRYCFPNTRFMLHQPAGDIDPRRARDLEIEAEEALKMRDRINRIFARATGQPLEKIERDTKRNGWLDAEEALAYGLAGRIIERADEIDAGT